MHGLGIVMKGEAKQTARSLSPIILVARMLDFSVDRMTHEIWACQKYGEANGIHKNKAEAVNGQISLLLRSYGIVRGGRK